MLFNNTNESAVLYIDEKLKNRKTFYEWDNKLMGPAQDNIGFEQGSICASDYYKIYSKKQLTSTQRSNLGVDIGSSVVSSIGQADDTILVSDDIYNLKNLLSIIDKYCHMYKVKLVPSKTKLLCIGKKQDSIIIDFYKMINPIALCHQTVPFSDSLEHVGVTRSVEGNLVTVAERIKAQKRALGSILSVGLAKSHLSNPLARLRVLKLYGNPTLFSALPALYLNKRNNNP